MKNTKKIKKLSKFDVLLYIADLEGKDLVKTIRKNIKHQKISERTVLERTKELKELNLITKNLEINKENEKVFDYLVFLYWCKLREREYNELLENKTKNIFKIIFENYKVSLKEIVKKTGFSKPTILKYLSILIRNNFVEKTKERPLVLKANLNDVSFFYVNIFDFSFKGLERVIKLPRIAHIKSKKLMKKIIELHTYSTTVTEGNTASEEDVRKIFDNFSVKLTPREVLEIVNTKKAINRLYEMKNNEIKIDRIKELHRILMTNLIETPGEFEYGRKRIVGSDIKLPTGRKRIEYSVISLLNFYKKNAKKINPQLMGCLLHFMFVTIHPFIDGNGRIARFLHSWILLKNKMPPFVFDPNKRNRYFDVIEEGRKKSIENFVTFCVSEHKDSLEKLK